MDTPTIAACVAWLACTGLSLYVAAKRGRSTAEGLWIGLIFGPLGVVAVGLLPAVDDREEMERLDARRRERPDDAPVAFDEIAGAARRERDDLVRP